MSEQDCGPPPDGEPYAAVIESHLSSIVLLGALAFKVKKPIALPFLDLRARADRERICRDELALNRRLAPDVYLGLAGLDAPDLPAVAHEPVLVMRRMPAGRRLSALLGVWSEPVLSQVIDDVARQVAALHVAEPPVTDFDLTASTQRLWSAGTDQLRPFVEGVLPGDQFDEIVRLWVDYLAGRTGLLRERQSRGLVRDGHGDLLTDDIFCLADGPRILDCLEFDRALRVNDVLADVAFLAMDLQVRGAPALARLFVDRYREYSNEHHPRTLADHYVAYRAFVRTKVECLRYGQGDADAAVRARARLSLALDRLRAGRVHLVIVGGLPGSGKSTIAAELADHDDREWALLSSDVVRRDLCGGTRSAGADAPYQGHYDRTSTAATYTELLRRAGLALQAGESVVLDASWTEPAWRTQAADLARKCSATFTQVRCTAPIELCENRLATRVDARASDASPAVLRAMAARGAAWPQARLLDTTRPLAESLAAVQEWIETASVNAVNARR